MLENINIHDLKLDVKEIIAYWNAAGAQATGLFVTLYLQKIVCGHWSFLQRFVCNLIGPYKGVLPLKKLLNLDNFEPNEFDLSSDSLNNYNGNILADAQIVLAKFGEGDSELQRTTIDSEVIGWAEGNNGLSNGFLVCNGDGMFIYIYIFFF